MENAKHSLTTCIGGGLSESILPSHFTFVDQSSKTTYNEIMTQTFVFLSIKAFWIEIENIQLRKKN